MMPDDRKHLCLTCSLARWSLSPNDPYGMCMWVQPIAASAEEDPIRGGVIHRQRPITACPTYEAKEPA